ncbi:monofunctional biosynthetic peptidoglycan transglycosylase [Agarivorans sp. TSD2052]|uniref:monofunctional biosynthetic peptidoglycan transglycosylase n=1 Tax=Agarivorans sp. TSD2052 TaxID=2937286 RepID=UPI00200F8CCF|nr:monofunctional biosynthetic peptidoglycan transglycosylase [Agarivorans sp. TSD2052]UPW17669.1 monofunctional biosynthetic peptidoglycan transglycosylase [Agarivorans sp. TSD2052]
MLKRLGKGLLWLFVGIMISAEIMVLALRWIDPPIWAWRIHRSIDPPSSYPQQINHDWRGIDEISPNMSLAVVAAEDQKFPVHWGIDFASIWQAVKDNQQGSRLRGASTITQQTAKNLWLWPSQSYWRKALEAGFSLMLELNLSKSRILEVYLNIAEYGPGIYGVEAASQHYFKHSSKRLSREQAASLAALLPSPYRYQLWPRSAYINQRILWISQQMRQLGGNYLDLK